MAEEDFGIPQGFENSLAERGQIFWVRIRLMLRFEESGRQSFASISKYLPNPPYNVENVVATDRSFAPIVREQPSLTTSYWNRTGNRVRLPYTEGVPI